MATQAKVLRVFVASPGDCIEYREAVETEIRDWNSSKSENAGCVLLPMRWELDAVPQQGADGQTIINDQLLAKADCVIALFWSRLGTHTGRAESGTVEEMQRAASRGIPVHVLGSKERLPHDVDGIELERLRHFLGAELFPGGLVGSFENRRGLGTEVRKVLDKLAESQNAIEPKETPAGLSERLPSPRFDEVIWVRLNRDDHREVLSGLDWHFEAPQERLELFSHAFRTFNDQDFERRIRRFFQRDQKRELCISLLDPDPALGIYLAYGYARGGAGREFAAKARHNLHRLLVLRVKIAGEFPGDRILERFAIETHSNLFASLIFHDRGSKSGHAQVEYVFSNLDDQQFTGFSFQATDDPQSHYALLAKSAEDLRSKARVWRDQQEVPVNEPGGSMQGMIGHRGVAGEIEEHTLRGFEYGIALGLESFEFDVGIASDNVPMCVRSDSRLLDGRQLRSTSSSEMASLGIPTVEAVLDTLVGYSVVIELKAEEHDDPTIFDPLIDLLDERKAHGVVDRVTAVSSFVHAAVDHFAQNCSSHREVGALLWRTDRTWQEMVEETARSTHSQMHIHHAMITDHTTGDPDLVEAAHKRGLTVTCWTADEPETARQLRRCGVDAIITNNPKRAVAGWNDL